MRGGVDTKSGFLSAVLAALCTLFSWLLTYWVAPGFLAVLEETSGDWLWRVFAGTDIERRVILVDIDEASLRDIGPWPWPRERLTELSNRLASEGAALQIWDIVLAAPAPGDDRLAATLDKNRGVLSQVFVLDHPAEMSGIVAGALPWTACPPDFPQGLGGLANPAAYAGLPVGHITPWLEHDGVLRRIPAVICYRGHAYPALFLAALKRALPEAEWRIESGQGILDSSWRLVGLPWLTSGLPLDVKGNVRIPWTHKKSDFISVSARDILLGRVPLGLINNTWVVIGGSALGLGDRIVTPLDTNSAGMVAHAQMILGVLDASIPKEPAYGAVLSALALLPALSVMLWTGMGRSRPAYLLPMFGLVLALGLYGAKVFVWRSTGLWLTWAGTAYFLVLFGVFFGIIEHARQRRESLRLYRHLASYLPRSVADVLARRDPTDRVEAERRLIIVMYADIRNFSAYCESRPPEETAAILHTFFSAAERIVEAHGGTIESFHADAILAVWSLPGTEEAGHAAFSRHADAALAAAQSLLNESRSILPQDVPDDLVPLALGIGLESGYATVGSLGPARRRTHMAMGRVVTAAARLQEMTAELGHPILLGEGMAALIGLHRLESLGVFLLEGLRIPCHIYALPQPPAS